MMIAFRRNEMLRFIIEVQDGWYVWTLANFTKNGVTRVADSVPRTTNKAELLEEIELVKGAALHATIVDNSPATLPAKPPPKMITF
jgi:hypothetical protein